MINQLAQINLAPDGGLRGQGPLGLEGIDSTSAPSIFSNALTTTIGVISIIAFIWFTIQFFLGAVGIIVAGGDKGKVEDARNKITTGLIGVVVVIAAIFIIQLVGTILGIEILDIAGQINSLI